MSPFTKQILAELYADDPSLQAQEAELIRMIETVIATRLAAQLNIAFRHSLRSQILRAVSDRAEKKKLTNVFMPMRIWKYAAPAAVIAIAVLVWQFDVIKFTPSGPSGAGVTISRVGAEAFGNLSGGERQSFASGQSLTKTTALVIGEDAVASRTTVIDPSSEVKRYEFVYTNVLTLPNLPVLRRQSNLARSSLTSALANAGGLNLESFTNLQVDAVTLTENREDGYSLTYNFQEGTVYLNRQFGAGIETSVRETSLLAPDSIGQIRATDVPSDAELISIANSFLADHGISRKGLGRPVVRKDYLFNQTTTTGEKLMAVEDQPVDLYYPSDLTVVYPWDVNGQTVVDESGYAYGLNVIVNVVTNQVTSVSNITPLTFQSSDYALETDSEKTMAVVSRGGLYNYQPEPAEGVSTVQITLGAPESGYVLIRYQLGDGTHDYLVPALIFPIAKVPAGETLYQTAVVVPLVKELLDQAGGLGGELEVKPLPAETLPSGEPGSGDGAANQ